MVTYSLSSQDIESYTRHGLIRIEINKLNGVPNKRKLDIDLEKLVETSKENERPSHIVIKRKAGEAPEVQIANSKSTKPKKRPRSTFTLDQSRELKTLRVQWIGLHPGRAYNSILVTPIYKT